MRTVPLRLALTLGGLAFAAVPLARAQEKPARVEIILGIQHAVSPPMRRVTPTPPFPAKAVIPVRHPLPQRARAFQPDPVLQTSTTAVTASNTTAGSNIPGISGDGYIPPDTNLAVGANQVVQMVNVEYTVYDTSGNQIQAPMAIHNIFANLGAPCGTSDGGDPIVLYDQIAGRWLISQLEYNNSMNSNYECVAISQTDDATGSYNLYALSFGNNLPDYPKWGVWPDAYYLTANLFHNGSSFQGAVACALPSSTMQSGGTVTISQAVCFQEPSEASLLPADFQGSTPPSAGEPEFFANFDSTLELYRFHVDFTTPDKSTFTGPISVSGAASFTEACGGGACIPQPGTHQKLDSLGDRLMFPLTYRNFGTYESLLVAQSVQVGSGGQTGIRWYEIDSPDGSPAIRQQGTYSDSGDATTYRWMGSIAQDAVGDMAVGYSVSNGTSVYPGIRIAGRVPGDSPGTLESETDVVDGTGHQTKYDRWGDYSAMSIDPSDDCTFWYTTEYKASSGSFNWSTYIDSFRFNNCGSSTTSSAPAAPVLSTPTAGNGYVSLSWSASSGATSYNVYREASGDTTFTKIASPSSTSYTDNSVTNGTIYYYYVTAVNSSNQESAASSTLSATPQAAAAPSAPTGLTATSPGKSGKVNLSWTQSTSPNITENIIYRGMNGATPSSYVTVSATTSYSDSSVTKGTNYCYEVSAVNASGQQSPPSAPSSSSCVTPATGGK